MRIGRALAAVLGRRRRADRLFTEVDPLKAVQQAERRESSCPKTAEVYSRPPKDRLDVRRY
jgi:hypothetical protein